MAKLIGIHMIQNHSPANLNRDDLGVPKTCFFGGVLRSRISSQCLKRSIRMSPQFDELGSLPRGVRTRQLAKLIAEGDPELEARAERVIGMCGFAPNGGKSEASEEEAAEEGKRSKMLIFTTRAAIVAMAKSLKEGDARADGELAQGFAAEIAGGTLAPDMALFGRMLEPKTPGGNDWNGKEVRKVFNKVWQQHQERKTVEASAQVAHAISTHEARPETDYYTARDDVHGDDAGAGYVGEAAFASACFYKYFSIDWGTLVGNLEGIANAEAVAQEVVAAFVQAATLVTPTGKQNSFAAHNPPDGILVEMRETPLSYANAFARPVVPGERDIVEQSVAQLSQYVYDLDTGYGAPSARCWFSPNGRYRLEVPPSGSKPALALATKEVRSLDELIAFAKQAVGSLPRPVAGAAR